MLDIRNDIFLIDCLETTVYDDFSLDSDLLQSDNSQYSIPDLYFENLEYLEIGDVVITEEESFCPNLNDIQDNFLCYVKEEEKRMFGQSFVEHLFSRYKCPIDDIIKKSRTELWFENSIYGLQFQAFLCLSLDISLPIVPNRNRKVPADKNSKLVRFNDPILDHLMRSCDKCSATNNVRKRLAPRDQVSLLIFVLDILSHPYFQQCIRWKDKSTLTFEILKPKAVAYFWMIVKENEICSFENFTRAIRFKRNAGVFKHIDHKKRRVYQFNQKALKEYKSKRHSNKLTVALIKILTDQ